MDSMMTARVALLLVAFLSGSEALQTTKSSDAIQTTIASLQYGPGSCVSLSRPQSTCVLSTSCKGENIDDFEFSFLCASDENGQRRIQKHSFGRGGFDAEEVYDTQVKCDACTLPPAAPAATKKGSVLMNMRNDTAAARKGSVESSPPKNVVFGRDFCVHVTRSMSHTCVVETKGCSADALKDQIGFSCLNGSKRVVHLFGADNFKSDEVFDSAVSCDYCSGAYVKAAGGDAGAVGFSTHQEVSVAEFSALKMEVMKLEKKLQDFENKKTRFVLTKVDEEVVGVNHGDDDVVVHRRHRHHHPRHHVYDEEEMDTDEE